MATLENELRNLAPRAIDPSKCKPATSLYQQTTGSVQNKQRVLAKQNKQFNLGNGQTFQDPIKAAEYLLEREYGKSFLFDATFHEPIFIPSEFVCSQYFISSTAVLESNIEVQMKKILENLKEHSPDDWFTKDLDLFLHSQKQHAEISQTDFDYWISKAKVMYLVTLEPNTENLNLRSTMSPNFIQHC